MKIRAEFSWSAPRTLFSVDPGSPEQVCQAIRRDIEATLQHNPSLRALEERYDIVGTTSFWLEDQKLPGCFVPENVPGSENYQVIVTAEGDLLSDHSWSTIAAWDADEYWDEFEECSSLRPPAIQVNSVS